MTQVRGILFDKDGTLFDFCSTWEAWAQSFLRRIARDDAHARALGTAIGFDFDARQFEPESIAIAGTPDEIAQALAPVLPDLGREALVRIINDEATAAPQVEVVPLHSFLSELRDRNLRVGVVTNDAEAPARAHLGTAGAMELLDFIAGFDSGFGAKPGPGPLLAFAEEVGLRPADVVMVGDSLHDLLAARAAGMRAIAVLTGLADKATLSPHAVVVLPDIGHIPMWLETQNL